jgi:phospholipase/carboxylesterase
MLLVAACTFSGLVYFRHSGGQQEITVITANPDEIEYIEYQTGIDPVSTVIWLHGLGADGHDFEGIPQQLDIPGEIPVRFIFPHAPMRPITVNGGMLMRGWYDVTDVPIDPGQQGHQDRDGLEASAAIVRALVDQENRRGIATDRIFLAGFSQGGAIVLFAGLRMEQPLAGIIALSTYLPVRDTFEQEKSAQNQDTPIFFGHGTGDEIIPLAVASRSREFLEGLGYSIEWHTYDMPHSVHPLEIRDISNFLVPLLESFPRP